MKYIILFLFLVLAGCQEPVSETKTAIKMQTIKTKDLSVSVPVTINAETIFPIKLKFQHEVTIVSSRLIGITMDMGIIPVIFKNNPEDTSSFDAQLLVGACTSAVMQSRLEIVWLHNGQEKYHHQVITINR